MASLQLQVLFVEDIDDDARLIVADLERGGFAVSWARVEDEAQLVSELRRSNWDVVISDFALPQFDGLAALAVVRRHSAELPFILVSGTVGEETAVRAMRAGASDYFVKGNTTRLGFAIDRELKDRAARAESVRAEERLKTQLLVSDRMASVGVLAAGVAHEINNPMAAVIANLNFAHGIVGKLLSQPAHEDPAKLTQKLADVEESLRDAKEASDRVRHIIKDLNLFSRSGDEEHTAPINLQRVLDSSARMVWNEVRHRARLVKRYDPIPFVDGNESRMGQVFLNLMINAAQALPEGHADRNEICLSTRQDETGAVIVEVSDTGPGIPADVLPRLFTPFFTTKPLGIGTGLGLSICQRIVSELGGDIKVDTKLGVGTTFRIILPPSASALPVQPAASAQPGGQPLRGKLLIVDDEPSLTTILRRILSPQHEVTVCGAGRDALERLRAGARFDVILCDLMMPEMTGMELHEELSKLAPDQAKRMVFLTGGAFTQTARSFLDTVPNTRVDKPFDPAAIEALIAEKLRSR